MSETTTDESATPDSPAPASNRGQVISIVALVLSLVAVGLAGWSLFSDSDSSEAEPTYSEEQRADAKTQACDAFDTVRRGVALNTNAQAPADDPAGAMAVAANARLSMLGGGEYLLSRIDPATPDDLKNQVSDFATNLMEIGAASTAGVQTSDPAQADRMQKADELSVSLTEACQE